MQNSIKLPQVFAHCLEESRHLHGAILTWLGQLESFLLISRLPFFPEYTDHGPQHISDVLATAASLIRDEAFRYFTPMDSAALIVAVGLHDIAMHLTPDG